MWIALWIVLGILALFFLLLCFAFTAGLATSLFDEVKGTRVKCDSLSVRVRELEEAIFDDEEDPEGGSGEVIPIAHGQSPEGRPS